MFLSFVWLSSFWFQCFIIPFHIYIYIYSYHIICIKLAQYTLLYMLEVTKIYIDRTFKTEASKSDSDFTIELPNTINIPEGTTAYINDIVLPVSWTTLDERHNTLYFFNITVCRWWLWYVLLDCTNWF